MTDNAPAFPARWAPQHPECLQLYSLATPNGRKVGIMLEETGLPYEAHRIDIMQGDQFDPDFVRLNPNSKIPCILDPQGPDRVPMALMESGAILLYLAGKSGQLLPEAPAERWQATAWLMFQVGSIGPMFGQFGHFHKFARDKTADDYARQRYTKEVTRLLGVLESRLDARDYLLDSGYSVADIATFPWVEALNFYQGKEAVDYARFPAVEAWLARCLVRPAVQRGLKVCA
ncbi:MAG: glutathione S-transferase N-terminal domain-containing protein [Polyangiales bacterium]